MNAHPGWTKFLEWLVNHSLQAGVLVLLIVLAQWMFRRRLTNRWRFALWWVVLARLLLPVGPQSAISVFNYLRPPASVRHSSIPVAGLQESAVTMEAAPQRARLDSQAQDRQSGTEIFPAAGPAPAQTQTPERRGDFKDYLIPAAAAVWLGGIAVLAACVLVQICRFQWKLSRSARKGAAALEGLLEECRRAFAVRRRIELLETRAVKSPALFGLFRLRLLLPEGFSGRFSERELRYIFLHELAHVKRGDLWLNWVISGLQIAHWFNPLIWFGFARLRSDRELACDELALLHAGEKAGTPYGETIIKLLEGLSRPAAIPGLVGILEDRKQMRRRIRMIAHFKKPGRWSALALLLVGAIAAATLTDAQSGKAPESAKATSLPPKQLTGMIDSGTNITVTLPDEEDADNGPRPDLTGEVRAKGGGPLKATVFIATAGPKTGTSVFCPSCYADCRKSAKADAEGQFKIESLSPRLIFRILAVAKGYKPKFVAKVDPAKGPVTIELEPITAADAPPERSLRGRVVDATGTPIEGATVEMEGVESKDGRGSWGAISGVDPLAVTDEKGEFLITAKDPFDMMDVTVEARLFARKGFDKLPSGGVENELKITEGSTLTGHVMVDGKPLQGVAVGVSAVDRNAGSYLGHFEVGTGANGAFMFVNLPPDADFWVYGIMSTMKQYGAIPIQKIHTAKDGETLDVGDLALGPAHRLRGRVELADGQPVPPRTRLLVSRDEAWDTMQLTLDKDGGFETTGLPAETVSLSVRVKGYHVSLQNKSLDRMNFWLIGKMDADVTNLVYLLEKGPDPQRDYNMQIPESEWPQNRTLAGAEGGADHSREWKVSGRVFDSETKQAISGFCVTPGQVDAFSKTGWDSLRAAQGDKSGSFLVYVNKRVATPLLKVEADGYLPGSLTLQPGDAANLEIPLTKGTGPAGIVAFPDGTPVAGASVVLICEGQNHQVDLNSRGELTAYWNNDLIARTDAGGHFSFKPQLDIRSVAAATTNGFAVVPIEALKTNAQITLQPFGKITGVLKRPSGPATNEDLDVDFIEPEAGYARINLQCHAVTDSQGRFTFDGVPPGHLELSYRIPFQGGHSWENRPLQEIDLQPAQTLDLKVEAPERSVARAGFGYQPPHAPERIPGVQITGVVLSPDGKPAADVDVGLEVEGIYLAIGKAELRGGRQEGVVTASGRDGSFSLPLYEKASSVVAVNEEGFARVWLEELKASRQIKLQKWGRVEGTLEINHHPGSNEMVSLQALAPPFQIVSQSKAGRLPRLIYENSAFQAKTDNQGHFTMIFVPPGEVTVDRLIRDEGNRSYTTRRLGTLDVKAGEVTAAHLKSNGRTVTGKVAFKGTNSAALSGGQAFLNTIPTEFLIKLRSGTLEERSAFMRSPEFKAVQSDARYFPATLLTDGTFRVPDVTPGKYYFGIDPKLPRLVQAGEAPTNLVMFASAQEIVVPASEDKNSETPFDAGTLAVKAFGFSVPEN